MALTKPKLSTNINTDTSVFTDPILVLHQGSTSADVDVGFLMNRSNGLTSNAAVIWQESSKSFVHILTNSSGAPDANLTVQSYANVSVGNVLLIENAGIYVDGTLGSAGQVLASDGSKSYWASASFTGGVVSNVTIFQSNVVIANTTASTSDVTGALVVLGGIGVGGNIELNGGFVANIADPVAAQDAATKNYVDTQISGFSTTTISNGSASVDTIDDGGTGNVVISGNTFIDKVYTTSGVYWSGNGAAFTSTTIANTAEITANLASGQNVGLSLTTTGVVAGNYGSATSIPTIVVDSKGRITSVTSNVVSTTINLAGGSGSGSVAGGGTLTVNGTSNQINTTVSSSTITIALAGNLVTPGNLTVTGNLNVLGNTITIGSNNLTVVDSIIDLHTFANLQPHTLDDGRDIGIRFHYYKGFDDHAFLGWENSTQTLIYLQSADEASSNITGTFGNVQFGSLLLSNTTAATSTTTGALQVRGGVGITGNVYANVFYTIDGIRWAGNGVAFTSGGGGGSGTTFTANTAPPTLGNIAGDMWYNTTTDILYEYVDDGTSRYWVDVQSLGQTGNIVSMIDTTLSGNIVVGLSNVYSIGTSTGYLRNIFANSITANSITVNTGSITGNLFVGSTADQSILLNSYPEWAANAARQSTRSFTSASAPTGPIVGDIWFDTSTDILFVYANDGVANYWLDVSTQTANANAAVTGTTATIFGNGTFYGSVTVNINNNAVAIANGGTDGVGNIGQSGSAFNTIFARATSALYADLAEIYKSDENYEAGTVVIFGGPEEITITNTSHDGRVAGVVSTNPAYIMNSESDGLPVALTGRVPCFVKGPVSKGDILVTSNISGISEKLSPDMYKFGCVLGKSLEEIHDNEIKKIEIAVGRF